MVFSRRSSERTCSSESLSTRGVGGVAPGIVSVDSAQVYRGMDIGTAKPDRATREQVPHHLVDIIDPDAHYSAARFAEEASRAIVAIRPDLPVALTSGYITEDMQRRAPEAGVRELIYKPDTVKEMCDIVARLLGKKVLGNTVVLQNFPAHHILTC